MKCRWESVGPTSWPPTPLLATGPGCEVAWLRRSCARLCHDRPQQAHPADPGFDRTTGDYTEHGIPGPVVAQYLRENRIVPEKNDLNSLLFLHHPRRRGQQGGHVISGLVAFKRLHDDNALLEDAIPEFFRRRPQRYACVRLRDLCGRCTASSARRMSAVAGPAVFPRASAGNGHCRSRCRPQPGAQ